MFDEVHVDADRLFVRSSTQVWTAGGVSAGIDLALTLVEAAFSAETLRRNFIHRIGIPPDAYRKAFA